MGHRSGVALSLVALFCVHAAFAADRPLSPADLDRLRKGGIIIETRRSDSGTSGGWSAALIDRPPDLVWRAVCSPQLLERYIKSIPRSVLLDESTATLVTALGDVKPDVVEGVLRGAPVSDWKLEADGRWSAYTYQRARFPWPLKDRWALLRIVSDDRTMVQVWEQTFGSMKEYHGSWSVRAAPGGGTLLVGEVQVHVPGAALELLTPLALQVSVQETYRGMQAMAADLARVSPTCLACPGYPLSR